MKKIWLVLIVLVPALILIVPGCKKSKDEEKVKVKAVKQEVRKEAYREVRDTVDAVKMEDSGMVRDTTAGKRN